MRFLFTNIFDDDVAGYISAKLAAVHQRSEADTDLATSTQTAQAHVDHPDLAFVAVSDIPDVPEEHATEVKVMKRGARQEASIEIPMLPGETLQHDVFTYLAQPLGDSPAGNAVLVRTAKGDELTILFGEIRYDGPCLTAVFEKTDPRALPLTARCVAFHASDATVHCGCL